VPVAAERLKLSCERLTRRARDADSKIPDAGEKPDLRALVSFNER